MLQRHVQDDKLGKLDSSSTDPFAGVPVCESSQQP